MVVAVKREKRDREMEVDRKWMVSGDWLYTGLKTLPNGLTDRATKGGNGESCSMEPEI